MIEKTTNCPKCEFDNLPGEYTLPFVHEIKHTCGKEDIEIVKMKFLQGEFKPINTNPYGFFWGI